MHSPNYMCMSLLYQARPNSDCRRDVSFMDMSKIHAQRTGHAVVRYCTAYDVESLNDDVDVFVPNGTSGLAQHAGHVLVVGV